MAITVDPKAIPVAPPAVVTSTDGLLSAKVDAANAGVMLRADLSSRSPAPVCVRFFRGDGSLVRSGDPAWAPGGVAHAYDHEAPLGTGVSYYAQPIDVDLAPVGEPTSKVAVEVPWTGDLSDVWLKNPSRPDLSLRLPSATFEETGRPLRTTFTDVPGARLGISSATLTGGLSGTLTVKSATKAAYDTLLQLLDGSILLMQAHPDLGGAPQMYARPTDNLISQRAPGATTGYGWDKRLWPIAITECRRPATLDAPLRIPGLTWESVAAQYVTWENLAAQVDSWDDLLWGWLERGEELISYDVLDGGSFGVVSQGSTDLGGF